MTKITDLTGKKFGRLTVIERALENTPIGSARWHCKCGCGTACIINGAALRNGRTKSCGCLRKFNPKMAVNHKTLPDEIYEDGLPTDEILGKC